MFARKNDKERFSSIFNEGNNPTKLTKLTRYDKIIFALFSFLLFLLVSFSPLLCLISHSTGRSISRRNDSKREILSEEGIHQIATVLRPKKPASSPSTRFGQEFSESRSHLPSHYLPIDSKLYSRIRAALRDAFSFLRLLPPFFRYSNS